MKWSTLTFIFAVQMSRNFNTSAYPNVVNPPTKVFHITGQAVPIRQMTFLVFCAFGCELWAPRSEEFGRVPILQISLGLVIYCKYLVRSLPIFEPSSYAALLVAFSLQAVS